MPTTTSQPAGAGLRRCLRDLQTADGRLRATAQSDPAGALGADSGQRGGHRLERRLTWLATIASTSPFVGLFGTVMGIVDAFHGLGTAGAATLRAVAPGISEALITTAAGLFVAVPP